MRRQSFTIVVSLLTLPSCDQPPESSEAEIIEFRSEVVIDTSPPAANAPVVATLVPGQPFEHSGRYAFVKAPGVGPNMSWFSPENVESIPRVRSGEIVAVKRGGQISRARIIGVSPTEGVVFRPQQSSPFTHAFGKVPWTAWDEAASAMQGCAAAIADERIPCIEASGNEGDCDEAASEELGECASGQDYQVAVELGGIYQAEFMCLLPPPHSLTLMGEAMNMGGCDGEFWGTVTQEPGFSGCADVYSGVWVDEGDCASGPAGTIILDRVSP